jgi:hypothetical protein
LMCLHAGAARVWGIDSTGAIEIARESFARAGLSERYVCVHGRSHRVELPQPADVVICDHVGCFGFDYGIIDTLHDAQKRFLRAGGKLVPSRINLLLGAVESSDCRKIVEAWSADSIPVEYHWLREYGINTKHLILMRREDFLGGPATLGTIDLGVDNPEFLSFKTELHVTRDGVLDGIAGWFECELVDGVWMTNSPLSKDAIERDQVFLPIDRPFEVKTGERLGVSVVARPTDNVISWTVEATSSARRFAHSTWKSSVMTQEDIARAQLSRTPRLSRLGQARKIVMDYCDGKRTSREIEQAVLRNHPRLFPTREEISRFVRSELGRNTD